MARDINATTRRSTCAGDMCSYDGVSQGRSRGEQMQDNDRIGPKVLRNDVSRRNIVSVLLTGAPAEPNL